MKKAKINKDKTMKLISMIIKTRKQIAMENEDNTGWCDPFSNLFGFLMNLDRQLLIKFGFIYKNRPVFPKTPNIDEIFEMHKDDAEAIYNELEALAKRLHNEPVFTLQQWFVKAKKEDLTLFGNIYRGSVYFYFVFSMYKQGLATLNQTMDAYYKSQKFDFNLLQIERQFDSVDYQIKEMSRKSLPLYDKFLKYIKTKKFKKAIEAMFYKADFEELYFEVVL